MLTLLAVALAGIHFGVPLGYYSMMKHRIAEPYDIIWKNRRYDLPKVVVFISAHNEAHYIEAKLDSLLSLKYPNELLSVILVDDGSTDGTYEKATKWRWRHRMNVTLIRNPLNQGKLAALSLAMPRVDKTAEALVLTDADITVSRDAFYNALGYFADSTVGCVTCSISSHEEKEYRSYFNNLRVAESKLHSTPIFNGQFMVIRMTLVTRLSGLPAGSDDSMFGSLIAFMGYRAIVASDVRVLEPLRGSVWRVKVRRARRLLQNFIQTKSLAKKRGIYVKSSFDKIWMVERWLHLVNPWLLPLSGTLLIYSALLGSIFAAVTLLASGICFGASRLCRTWVAQQVFLMMGAYRLMRTKDSSWTR